MRAMIGDIEIEGTADEIAALLRSLGGVKITVQKEHNGEECLDEDDLDEFVTAKVAKRALKRRPLSSAQRMPFQDSPRQLSGVDLSNRPAKSY